MANIKDYMQGRADGLLLAQKIVAEGGADALDAEIRFRNHTKISTALTRKELELAIEPIKLRILDTVLAMPLNCLHDVYGFGNSRLKRFKDAFEGKSECMNYGYLDWSDVCGAVKDETGIEVSVRHE